MNSLLVVKEGRMAFVAHYDEGGVWFLSSPFGQAVGRAAMRRTAYCRLEWREVEDEPA